MVHENQGYFLYCEQLQYHYTGMELFGCVLVFIAFMLGDMLMVLVTFMVGGQVGALNAQLGEGYELDGIVIAVLGGVSLGGGIGSVFGIFMGTMVFQFLLNFLLLTGMGTYLEQVIKGILLVIIVLFSTVLEYRQKNATK